LLPVNLANNMIMLFLLYFYNKLLFHLSTP
jgi:hypothetical protein